MPAEFKKTLRAAAAATLPVFFGYVFVGMAFGLLLQKAGYHPLWALASSLFVYAGSMQFVLVELLSSWSGLVHAAVITLAVNIRHAFYGLSLIEKFQGLGARRPYQIFSLTDETYSLLCSVKTPEGVDQKRFYFWIALLDQSYWVAGSLIGATVGELVAFDSTGIDFAMTALFIVIFVEQWLTARSHLPALVGLVCAAACLLVFGPLFGTDSFLPPALLLVLLVLLLGRKQVEQRIGEPEQKEVQG